MYIYIIKYIKPKPLASSFILYVHLCTNMVFTYYGNRNIICMYNIYALEKITPAAKEIL